MIGSGTAPIPAIELWLLKETGDFRFGAFVIIPIPRIVTASPTSPIQRRKCRNWLIYRCRRQKVGTTERLVKRTGVGSLR